MKVIERTVVKMAGAPDHLDTWNKHYRIPGNEPC